MPWKRNRELLRDIDKLPHGPDWQVETIKIAGDNDTFEVVDFWKRNPLDSLKQMLLDKQLGRHMKFVPQRHWTSRERKKRCRGEMWTSDLMWELQVSSVIAQKIMRLTSAV
jgi:hypothetical protein